MWLTNYQFIVKQFYIILIFILQFVYNGKTQLLINVQNQGGEVVQETITSNVNDDVIMLEFQRTDGTLVTQLIDFRNDVQIIKALVLGEEERGQSQYQVMCFVTQLDKSSFISSDAMAKLRQKNPSTIRQPEEDQGTHNYTMTAWMKVSMSNVISRHISQICSEAPESTYVRDYDLGYWLQKPGVSIKKSSITSFPPTASSRCADVTGLWAPCYCKIEICIGWFPCGLKFCKGKTDSNNVGSSNTGSYRCGIKTCRKCNSMLYYVSQKQQCLWDE